MTVTYFVRMTAMPGMADEVRAALMTNYDLVSADPGNLIFAIHQGADKPDEFWVYETWRDQAAVGAHEASAAFLAYKARVRPLVDGASVLWGDTVPLATHGYGLDG